ncbi:MAG TPA: hypothetical protein DCM38_05025 [Gammaproteobacteria bacterium]|nr:hypothetical protein [Gammaproteobacteria bacterium]
MSAISGIIFFPIFSELTHYFQEGNHKGLPLHDIGMGNPCGGAFPKKGLLSISIRPSQNKFGTKIGPMQNKFGTKIGQNKKLSNVNRAVVSITQPRLISSLFLEMCLWLHN